MEQRTLLQPIPRFISCSHFALFVLSVYINSKFFMTKLRVSCMSCSFILKYFAVHFLGRKIFSSMSTVQLSTSVSLTVTPYVYPAYGLLFRLSIKTRMSFPASPPLMWVHQVMHFIVMSLVSSQQKQFLILCLLPP